MDKWQKIADYVMSKKADKWVMGIIIFFYMYLGAHIVRWLLW